MPELKRPLLTAILCAAAVYCLVRFVPDLWRHEESLRDIRFHLRGSQKPDPRVVLVAIDEQTTSALKKLGRMDEWPRTTHGKVIQNLSNAGAAVIGFDVTFEEHSRIPGDDEAFAALIRRACPVVLAMDYGANTREGGAGDRTTNADPAAQDWLETHGLQLDAAPGAIYNAYQWRIPVDPLRRAAAAVAYTDVPADSDGVYRFLELFRRDSFDRWREHLSTALFHQYVERSGSAAEKKELERLLRDPAAIRAINYTGPPGTIPRLSFADVARNQFDPAAVSDKIVLVGRTGPEEDLRPNPFSSVANGVEISANSLNSLLQRRFVRVSLLLDLGAVLLLSLCGALMIELLGAAAGLAGLVAAIAVYLGVTQALFNSASIMAPVLSPLLAAIASAGLALHYRLADEELQRTRVEAEWRSYVGPDVLTEIMSNRDLGSGAGVKVDVTVVFSDIRGYSTLSEKLAPEEVVRQINEHFSEMTKVVFACGGTVMGVTGDGLLMVFGWPRPYEDHADRAMIASRAIAEELASVNEGWAAEGRPTIDIGLGIHSGPVVAGRVGGEQGSQLTVIGDAVNVAARVQDLNKQLKTRILMTEDTKQRIKSGMRIGKSERVPIRGRVEGVVVYELLHRDNRRTDEPSEKELRGQSAV